MKKMVAAQQIRPSFQKSNIRTCKSNTGPADVYEK